MYFALLLAIAIAIAEIAGIVEVQKAPYLVSGVGRKAQLVKSSIIVRRWGECPQRTIDSKVRTCHPSSCKHLFMYTVLVSART